MRVVQMFILNLDYVYCQEYNPTGFLLFLDSCFNLKKIFFFLHKPLFHSNVVFS